MTQQDVIDYLKEHGEITNRIAKNVFGTLSLSSVVQNINRRGEYKIRQELAGRVTFDPNRNDKTYTKYILEESINQN